MCVSVFHADTSVIVAGVHLIVAVIFGLVSDKC